MILFIITYLAGVLTILSPCILPVLPFVFSKSQGSFYKTGLPLLFGMMLTFSVFSVVAIAGADWIGRANDYGRILALVMMTLLGLSLLFPHTLESFIAPLTQFGSNINQKADSTSVKGSILIGVGTGLLWAPCAGPILGLVLTGAASQHSLSKSIGLLVAYSLGSATSLSVALLAGNRAFKVMKKSLGYDRIVKKTLGVLVLFGVVIIAFNLDRTLLTQLSKFETGSIEQKLIQYAGLETKAVSEGPMPSIAAAKNWINSDALTPDSLKGKVVIIDFWTYSCINCLRTLPYLKAWYETYKKDGLVIIGIHTPEFGFEKDLGNVQKAVTDLKITYPVALDNEFLVWNEFKNQAWPAHYFIDRKGQVRHHHFGEGAYEESEQLIRKLLSEEGSVSQDLAKIEAIGIEDQAKALKRTPETYIGWSRAKNFVPADEINENETKKYQRAKTLNPNEWTLDGEWLVENERAVVQKPHASLALEFNAEAVHLVLGGNKKIGFKIRLDGKAPGEDHGLDIDQEGHGAIDGHRLYQLIKIKKDEVNKNHLLEIEFEDSEAEVYAFTFG